MAYGVVKAADGGKEERRGPSSAPDFNLSLTRSGGGLIGAGGSLGGARLMSNNCP